MLVRYYPSQCTYHVAVKSLRIKSFSTGLFCCIGMPAVVGVTVGIYKSMSSPWQSHNYDESLHMYDCSCVIMILTPSP